MPSSLGRGREYQTGPRAVCPGGIIPMTLFPHGETNSNLGPGVGVGRGLIPYDLQSKWWPRAAQPVTCGGLVSGCPITYL